MWLPDLDCFEGPKYKMIADAIEEDIVKERISPGFQLPPHRELADRLGVTVGTVTRAYSEASKRGLLRGETGRGSFVAGKGFGEPFLTHAEESPKNAVDMGMTLPLHHLDPPMSQAFAYLAEENDLQGLLRYYPSKGRLEDREIGARWLTRYFLDVKADQVLITAGGQNALALVLGSIFSAGDSIAVEKVTYPLFKTLGRRFGIKLVSVEMDEEGMLPEDLERIAHTHKLKGIYCMPTCHNPTAASMSVERRRAIAEIAEKEELFVIEDDAYALLSKDQFLPIFSILPDRTFYVASFSKAVCCGLRYGYLVLPAGYLKRVEQCLADLMWMVSPLSAKVMNHWIANGVADKTIRLKREEARKRNQVAKEILGGHQFSMQDTGYFVWLQLPEEWNSTDFAREASEHGVIVTPQDYFTVSHASSINAVRIALSGPDDVVHLRRGLSTVGDILRIPM